MLRKSFSPRHKKVLPVAPLVDAVTSEVVVSVTDPATGDTQERKEFITKVVPQKPTDAIRNEEADLYSIENMLNAGISPVTAPIGSFIRNDRDNFQKVNNMAAAVDAAMEDIDNMSSVESASVSNESKPTE